MVTTLTLACCCTLCPEIYFWLIACCLLLSSQAELPFNLFQYFVGGPWPGRAGTGTRPPRWRGRCRGGRWRWGVWCLITAVIMRTQPRLRHNGDCQIVRCRDKDTSSCCHLDTHQRRPWDTGTGGGLKDAFPTFCCFLLWRCSGSGGGRTGLGTVPTLAAANTGHQRLLRGWGCVQMGH